MWVDHGVVFNCEIRGHQVEVDAVESIRGLVTEGAIRREWSKSGTGEVVDKGERV